MCSIPESEWTAGADNLQHQYQTAIADVEKQTQQKIHQAEEEHKALTETVRQRLITSISKRRQQLLRDKEQLDIADSSALLLHPSHFSINAPGSPSGGQNRKTRHLRHRAISPGAVDENGKRKRKITALEDDGNESPAPAFRPLPPPDNLGGGRSPFKDAREKNAYAQYEAPAYSLERLFTEKELAMATNTAQIATYRYFHRPQHQSEPSNGVPSIPTDLPDPVDGLEDEAGTNTPPAAPAAPEMERSTSHQVLTRGGARANPLAALSDLATVAASIGGSTASIFRDNPFAPVVPNYHAVTRSEKSGAPAPPGVSNLDAENDFEMIRRAGASASTNPAYDDGGSDTEMADNDGSAAEMRRSLLDQALGVSLGTSQPYRLPLLETGPALIGKGVDRVPATGFAPVPTVLEQRLKMQAQAAAAAAAAGTGGGGAMASALRGVSGGEAMSRTTSAAGSEVDTGAVGGSGRRGRLGRLV